VTGIDVAVICIAIIGGILVGALIVGFWNPR